MRRSVSIVAAMLGFLAIVATPLGAAGAAGAERADRGEQHCVVAVTDVKDGVFVTGPEKCYGTEREATASYREGASLAGSDGVTLAASNAIGQHYTSTSYTGSSITILGTSCLGGVWYPSGSWNNNIESSRHYCGGAPTTFYDSSNCATSAYAIYNQVTSLGWMNNKPSCVRYG
jgi:hypothetical protein